MRYLNLTLQHMMEKREMILLIMLELVIAITTLSYFSTSMINQYSDNRTFEELALDHILVVKGDESTNSNLLELCTGSNNEVEYLGQTVSGISLMNSIGEIKNQVIPISESWLNCINYSYYDGSMENLHNNLTKNVMYVPFSMREQYQVGKTYSMDVVGMDRETHSIEVMMGGVLSTDKLYLPGGFLDIIDDSASKVMIYFGRNKEVFKESPDYMNFYNQVGRSYALFIKNMAQMDHYIHELEQFDTIQDWYLLDDNNSGANQWKSSKMGIPWIMSFTLIFMCIASFSSYTLLSIARREKNYAVYYMCGATWKKCLTIKILEDVIILMIPSILSLVIMNYLNLTNRVVLFSWKGQVLSVLLSVIIIFVSSSVSFLLMKKQSPVSLIRRCI